MVDAKALNDHTANAPIDYLTTETYAPLSTAVEVMNGGRDGGGSVGVASQPHVGGGDGGSEQSMVVVAGVAGCAGAAGAALGAAAVAHLARQ